MNLDLPPRAHRPPRRRRHRATALAPAGVAAAALAVIATLAAAPAARAEAPRFTAEVEQTQVTVGEPFTFQVTLSVGNDEIADYRPPDFKGLRVLAAPRGPNQSTQMQFGGGGSFIEISYTWRYELAATQRGTITIGPAHARVNGHDMKSSVVTVSAGAA